MRSSHTANDDRIFRWDEPPPEGHPGQDFGCRCRAEPQLPRNLPDDPPIEPVYPLEMLALGVGRAAWVGSRTALRAIRATVGRAGTKLRHWQDEQLFRRPDGVPEDWLRAASKKGDGVVYEKPGTKGATYVKIQRAEPNSSNIGQRYDNVRWMRNGQSLDVDGNIVPLKSPESYIPVKNFKFKPELFK